MHLRYREQYEDAVSLYLRAQETAGLDICTDGDAHFDEQISGMSWQSYPLTHISGFSRRTRWSVPRHWARRSTPSSTDKKVVIGLIDHHTLQVERPEQVQQYRSMVPYLLGEFVAAAHIQ